MLSHSDHESRCDVFGKREIEEDYRRSRRCPKSCFGVVVTAYRRAAGALNVRSAMRYVRDVVWTELVARDAEGDRAARFRTPAACTEAA